MNQIRKYSAILIFTVLFACIFSLSAYAWEPMANFNYWYSNGSDIGYFNSSSNRKILATTSGGGFSTATLTSYATHAKNAWSSEGNFSVVASGSDYVIRFTDITRAAARNGGVPNTAAAYTEYTSKTFIGYASYYGSKKSVYRISKAKICLIYDNSNSDYNTSNFSTSKWEAISAHEFGHAVGYMGHDTGSTLFKPSLMNPGHNNYWDIWRKKSPTTRDLHHMSNI